jgi:hypothetical protein
MEVEKCLSSHTTLHSRAMMTYHLLRIYGFCVEIRQWVRLLSAFQGFTSHFLRT